MPEYIDRNKLIPDRCYYEPEGYEAVSCEQIFHEDVADVIELRPILEEYEKLIQTNPTSKAVDEFCIKTMRKILCDYYVEKI